MKKALGLLIGSLLVTAAPFSVFADTIDSFAGGTSDVPIGGSNNWGIFLGYKPGASHNVCTMTFTLKTSGSPTDSLALDLYIGTTTYPTFASTFLPTPPSTYPRILAHADSQWQVRGSTYSDYTFTFTPCAVVVGANTYAFNLYATAGSATNTYSAKGKAGSGTPTQTGTGTFWCDLLVGNATFHSNTCSGASAEAPNFTINGTENFGAVAPSTTPSFAQSVIDQLAGISDSNATTTLTSAAGGWTNIPSYFARKVPWGYLFDIAEIYDSAATSTSEFTAITITYASSSVSERTRPYLPSPFTIFSTSTVTTYLPRPILDTFNTLLAAAGWLLAIRYWFNRGLRV